MATLSMRARWLLLAGTLAALGCDDPTASLDRAAPPAPAILSAGIASFAHNALGAIVTVRALHGDIARVHFAFAGVAPTEPAVTPAVRLTSDSTGVLLLGLRPGRRYVARVEVRGPGGTVFGGALRFSTAPLPPDLPRYEAAGDDPSPGFVVFAAGRFGIVIDNTGRVAWYREFPWPVGLSFMAQPNGRFTLRPQTPQPDDLEPWLEVDPSGAVTRTLGCARGLQPRPHDLIAEADGGYWIMCDETRVVDLRSFGGVMNARVTGTVVQHVAADGALLFEWNPFEHFPLGELDPSLLTGAAINWTHGNGIDLDADGDLLVSFRNLSEITKIDTRSGSVRWRLGGRANQFRFAGAAASPFAGQHGVRALADGSLLVFDNVGDPSESRAERYRLDAALGTGNVVRSQGSPSRALTMIGGSVQSLPGSRTLVSFGTAGRVEEHDDAGRLTWQVLGNAGYVFRAQRIASLYAPGIGTAR
jgi:hypothetical protein